VRFCLLFVCCFALSGQSSLALLGAGGPPSAPSGPAYITSNSAASTSGTSVQTGTGKNTAGANLITFSISTYGITNASSGTICDQLGTGTCSSSASTWTCGTNYTVAGGGASIVTCWASPGVTGSNYTVYYQCPSGGTCYPSIGWMAFSGAASSGVHDQENGNNNVGGTSSHPGSITPGTTNEIISSAFSSNDSPSGWSVATPTMAVVQTQLGVAFQSQPLAIAYLIDSSSTAINPTWSWTGAIAGAINIDSFNHQ
jgi:hypothetical protein